MNDYQAIAEARPDQLPALEESIRRRWRFDWRIMESPPSPVIREALASFAPNGYEREAAARRLAAIHDGSELPYLLLRLNDWVSQVREAAREAIRERLRAGYEAAFVANLFLVTRLRAVRRVDHAPLLGVIVNFLTRPSARDLMLAALDYASTRREVFAILTAPGVERLDEVVLRALTNNDLLIRLYATRMVTTALPPERIHDALLDRTRDTSFVVRREAMTQFAGAFPDEGTQLWRAALFDRSAGVREAAQFYVRRAGVDVAQVYRDALPSADLVAAIAGLGETGTAADAERLLPYLSNPRAVVRRAAVRAIVRVSKDQFVDALAALLTDASPAVVSAARRALRRYAPLIGTDRLWSLWESATSEAAHLRIFSLMAALPKWESITCIARVAISPVERYSRAALEEAGRWSAAYNRSLAAPTREQIARLKSALAVPSLDQRVAASIRFALSAYD